MLSPQLHNHQQPRQVLRPHPLREIHPRPRQHRTSIKKTTMGDNSLRNSTSPPEWMPTQETTQSTLHPPLHRDLHDSASDTDADRLSDNEGVHLKEYFRHQHAAHHNYYVFYHHDAPTSIPPQTPIRNIITAKRREAEIPHLPTSAHLPRLATETDQQDGHT
jgi:hypothetical protein